MRAQLVSENINFERGGKDHIYTKLDIGERERVLKFLDEIAGDIQFQKDEPEYMGFLNIGEDLIDTGLLNSSYMEAFRMFVKNWKKYLPDLEKRGLYLVDPPDLDETIFYDEPEPHYGVHAIRESLEFEREGTPLKKIGIGERGILDRVDWDKEFNDGEIVEEYIYKGWPIRIIRTYFGDIRKDHPNAEYVAISHKGFSTYEHNRLKWYKTARWAKTDIERRIDDLKRLQSLAKNPTIRKKLEQRPDIEQKRPFLDENMEFERGLDPKATLGIGRIPRIPLDIIKVDLEGEYGIDGEPGAIFNVEVIGPRRFQINFLSQGRIRNFSTNKIISKERYARYLVNQIGVEPLITNVNHAHGTTNSWIFTLGEEYKNIMPRETYNRYDLNEAYNFERGQDPKQSLGIGKEAKANQLEWDWHPDWDPMLTGEEKFVDLIHYPKPEDPELYIKVALVRDIHGGAPMYYAINNIGEPYNADMEYFDTPEEAIKDHKEYLDIYFEEDEDY